MAEEILARLTDSIPQPELSRMWESERTTFTTGSGDGIDTWLTAPEVDIARHGSEVRLRFLAGDSGARCRYRPDVGIAWET